jgi:hypothetical protein
MGAALPFGYRKSAAGPRDDSMQRQTGPDKSSLPRGSGELTMTWKGARSVSQLSVDIQLQASCCPEPRRAVCLCVYAVNWWLCGNKTTSLKDCHFILSGSEIWSTHSGFVCCKNWVFIHFIKPTTCTYEYTHTNIYIYIYNINPLLHVSAADRHCQGATWIFKT